ncbi:Nif3-like dinuclear metal center hexameric protein [Bombilactobacillus thymidiniphilus]|uniref:GTP cyclohydrolase 1 type 2 homolog n=1 Tax=Bombilactobacillus thymidiniphilus TaxID=2923363 RepID=A0ABY4PFF9_9LACO|nr:Nif3-like dinuclear metal center hexameric protein [Bombilactobacillus thymidiniphilus]UQS84385.1 Nif3-like dinuclear metal center hexameric protein [Bombilactobacillus thymidiniphilus]
MIGQQLVDKIEHWAPLAHKMPHDPTGMQLGDLRRPVKHVLTTLDVRPEVVQEAINQQVDFIFAHHPLVFRPARNLDLANPQNKMYADLLKHNITVYAAHTNIDKANPGMNDWLAQALNLRDIKSFAYDQNGVALGRLGTLTKPISVLKLAQSIKRQFALTGLRLISNQQQAIVEKIGIIGGDAGKFYPAALKAQVDVFITGDVYYHTAHDMLAAGLSVIDPGHHIEAIFKQQAQAIIEHWAKANGWELTVISSQCNTDPFTYI